MIRPLALISCIALAFHVLSAFDVQRKLCSFLHASSFFPRRSAA